MDVQEIIYEHIFSKLGFSDVNKIRHPVLVTEAIGNPISVRKQNTELLFEKFNVGSLCYGIDSLLSFSNTNQKNGVILSSGFYSTFVIPCINGSMDLENTKRISLAGFDSTDFMLRLLQLKYPQHRMALTIERTMQLKHNHCIVAQDYISQLRSLEKNETFDQFTHVYQLPYKSDVISEDTQDKRKQNGERLKKMAQEKREAKEKLENERLNNLLQIYDKKNSNPEDFVNEYKELGFEDEKSFMSELKKLNKKYNRTTLEEPKSKEDSETKKKMLEGAKRSREKKKLEKDKEDEQLAKKQKMEEEFRETNPEKWLDEMKEKRKILITKLERIRIMQHELKDKRSNVSKQKMKALAVSLDAEKSDEILAKSEKEKELYHLMVKELDVADEPKIEAEINRISQEIAKKEQEMGLIKNDFYSMLIEPQMFLNVEQQHQIHLTIERIRVPELIFQPNLVGSETMGLMETLEFVLNKYPLEQRKELVKSVYLCGGNMLYPGMKQRVEYELRSMLPYQSEFSVIEQSSVLDSWIGAAKFANNKNFTDFCIKKRDYEEHGSERFVVHQYSNKK